MTRALAVSLVFVAGWGCGGGSDPDAAVADTPPAIDVGSDVPVCVDRDGDGLSDDTESFGGSDPDGDGVANPDDLDSDGDGLSDHDESEPSSFGLCRRPSSCCQPRFLFADSDADGRDDGDEVAMGSDVCDADEDDDGCPDGETCGDALAGAVWRAFSFAAAPIVVDLPAASGAHTTLGVVVVGEGLEAITVRAVSSTPSGTASGAGFSDVPAGARLEVALESSLSSMRSGPERLSGEVQFVDGDVVVATRPLVVVVPECFVIPI